MAQYGPARRKPQLYRFPVDIWTKAAARGWLRVSGLKYEDLKKVGNFYHAPQFPADDCFEKTHWTERRKSLRDAAGRGRRNPKKFLAVFCKTARHP